MAKYETMLLGDFDTLLHRLHGGILAGSASASYEDGSNFSLNAIRFASRVYERYSIFGSNRVSMSISLIGVGNQLFVSIITSGGSQAVFIKINTVGEKTFLQQAIDIVESHRYESGAQS
jgi:hypothetical protein